MFHDRGGNCNAVVLAVVTLSTDPSRTSSSAFNVPVAVQTAGTDSFDEVDNPRFAVNEVIKNHNFVVGGTKIFPRLYVLVRN